MLQPLIVSGPRGHSGVPAVGHAVEVINLEAGPLQLQLNMVEEDV